MVDNFEQIESLLEWTPGEFYFVQILKRNKDGHKTNGNNRNRCIRDYYISNKAYWDKQKPEIIAMCQFFDARAMIYLGRRSYKYVAFDFMALTAESIKTGNIEHLYRTYASAVGRAKPTIKYWVVDVDDKDQQKHGFTSIYNFIGDECRPIGDKILDVIPSKTGCHLITSPFDVWHFAKFFPGVEVHKNNPTNLYIP